MEISKCVKCGGLFPSKEDLCPNCISRDLQDIANVRKFIIENPEITELEDISQQTKVAQKDILRYIKNGRLDDLKTLGKYFKCTKCGVAIERGKYCDDCLEKFNIIRSQLLNNK